MAIKVQDAQGNLISVKDEFANDPNFLAQNNYTLANTQIENKVEEASDITTINTDDAISDLNKDKEKLDELTKPPELPSYLTFKSGDETVQVAETDLKKQLELQNRGYKATTVSDKGEPEKFSEAKTSNLTLEETRELFGNDFTGIKQNEDGTFTPSATAYERIGITGIEDPVDTQLEGDLQELDNTITTLTNNFLNYNVQDDPDYQAEVKNITQQYEKMRSEMTNVNTSRKRAYETLGYRTGSTQFAGAIQLGIVGEEIKQGDERLAEITRQENAAKSAARKAFKDENYAEFAQTMDALDTLRTNKADELTRYTEKLAEANKLIQEQSKFELDTLKYQLDLKKSGETNLTKEYDVAVEQGFDGSLMDYQVWQEQMEETMPASYKEWQLAGGAEGTGKTYGEFIAKDYKGPASFQEWSLAGGQEGTGKTYAEWVGEKSGLSNQVINQVDKISASFDSSPIVKQYNEVLNKKISVDAMVEGETSGPVDLALVFEFMKALDPTSVVRESEYDAASKTGTIFKGWAAKFNGQFNEGEMLPDEVRQEFKRLVGIKFDAINQQYKNLRDEKARLINQKTDGDDGSDYLIDYGLEEAPEEITLPELNQSYASLEALLDDNPEYNTFIEQQLIPIFNEEGIEATNENVLQYLQESSFNQEGSDSLTALEPGTSENLPQRNLNPGNVKRGGVADKFAAKNTDGTPKTDSQGHLIFDTPEAGTKALEADLKAKISGNSRVVKSKNPTIAEIGKAWAEDPGWANKVAMFAGVTPQTKAQQVPFNKLVRAIARQEGYFA